MVEPTGADVLINAPLGDREITARVGPDCSARPGLELTLHVDMRRSVLFDADSEQRLA